MQIVVQENGLCSISKVLIISFAFKCLTVLRSALKTCNQMCLPLPKVCKKEHVYMSSIQAGNSELFSLTFSLQRFSLHFFCASFPVCFITEQSTVAVPFENYDLTSTPSYSFLVLALWHVIHHFTTISIYFINAYLPSYKASIVNSHEYKGWREHGVAFELRNDSTYEVSNRTLASGLILRKVNLQCFS